MGGGHKEVAHDVIASYTSIALIPTKNNAVAEKSTPWSPPIRLRVSNINVIV